MAFAMGISVEEFKHLTPRKLEFCLKGHNMKRQMRDEEMWVWFGKYGISAMMFAIDHCLSKNPRTEYEKEPVFSKIQTNGKLTEEQKQRELEEFIRQNERMRSKWKKKHKKESEHDE